MTRRWSTGSSLTVAAKRSAGIFESRRKRDANPWFSTHFRVSRAHFSRVNIAGKGDIFRVGAPCILFSLGTVFRLFPRYFVRPTFSESDESQTTTHVRVRVHTIEVYLYRLFYWPECNCEMAGVGEGRKEILKLRGSYAMKFFEFRR